MIKSSLESKEGRDVAIIDTPGEYLHSYVGKHGEHRIIVLFKGEFVELMVMVYPKLYQKYVTYDIKGDFMFYVEMNKAVYVLLQSALLFYKKLRKGLEAYSFLINPYDPCFVNAIIEVHQMTVTWHVYDLKVSHKDPYHITNFSSYLSENLWRETYS